MRIQSVTPYNRFKINNTTIFPRVALIYNENKQDIQKQQCTSEVITNLLPYFYFKKTLKEFFPSWIEVKRYEEVIKFSIGRMSDPTPLVRHVYEMYIENELSRMRTKWKDEEAQDMLKRMGKHVLDTDLFTSIYRESKIELPGHPDHNQYINRYNHDTTRRNKMTKDITPVYTPSRRYMFHHVNELIACEEHHEHHDEIPECAVIIAELVTKNVLSIIRKISQRQKISDLVLLSFKCDDTMETDIFNMSQNAKSLRVSYCDLPPGVIKHLLKEVSHCRQLTLLDLSGSVGDAGCYLADSIRSWVSNVPLQVLCLRDCKMLQIDRMNVVKSVSSCKHLTKLELSNNPLGDDGRHLAESITSWGSDVPLEVLWLGNCKMTHDASVNVVKSLSTCKRLTALELSGNTLGDGGRHLADTIRCWGLNPPLQQLGLQDCKMPQDASALLMSVLSACKKLDTLNLRKNTLTGSLPEYTPQLTMKVLNLSQSELNKEDLQYLFSLLQNGRLPKLKELWLIGSSLPEMAKELESLIEVCLTNHQSELKLYLRQNNLPKQYENKLKKLCDGKSIKLHFGTATTKLHLSRINAVDAGHADSIRCWGDDPPLQELWLKDSKLPVDIIKSIAVCKHLTHLSLLHCTLDAAGHDLADSITSWRHDPPLQWLQLRKCKMPKDALVEFIKSLSTCKYLTNIDLTLMTLGDEGCHLAQSIRSWGSDSPLQKLVLGHCKMPQDVCALLLSVLSSCKYLQHLILDDNILGGCLLNYAPPPTLNVLRLSHTALNKDDLQHLLNLLENSKLPQLKELFLVSNDLYEIPKALESLIEACITNNSQGELRLNLRNNNLSKEFENKLKKLCHGRITVNLDFGKSATKLCLSGKSLGDARLAESVTSWGDDPSLNKLDVRNCKMPEDTSVDVIKSLSACKHLTKLDLSNTTLGTEGRHLADSITTWGPDAPLQILLLMKCKMPQDASVDVVKSLSWCKHLTILDLSGNTLGDGGQHLAESIRLWGPTPPLEVLWLIDCEMPEGASVDVIKSLSACKHLTELDLSGNTLGHAGCDLTVNIGFKSVNV